jgi:hypothetical protein
MKCKLCLKDRLLLKRSHIIPDFQYKELYDEKHRIISFNIEKDKSKSIPTGEYESNILCQDCDNKLIGSLESYASLVFFGGTKIETGKFRKKDGLEFVHAKGINYKKFKLFLLSVLWRASISSRSLFKQVNLGPHEEEVRKMILSGDPGSSCKYPCMISSYRHQNILKEIVGEPRQMRIDAKKGCGITGYAFLIAGFLYIFKITKDDKDKAFQEAVINKNGCMMIPYITQDQLPIILSQYLSLSQKEVSKLIYISKREREKI